MFSVEAAWSSLRNHRVKSLFRTFLIRNRLLCVVWLILLVATGLQLIKSDGAVLRREPGRSNVHTEPANGKALPSPKGLMWLALFHNFLFFNLCACLFYWFMEIPWLVTKAQITVCEKRKPTTVSKCEQDSHTSSLFAVILVYVCGSDIIANDTYTSVHKSAVAKLL